MNKVYIKTIRMCLLTVVLSLVVVGCEQDPQLTAGATLKLSPQSRQILIQEIYDEHGVCRFDEQVYQDSPLQVVVTSANGSPIGGAKISIYLDYAGNSYPGFSALALYADNNGNGVIDSPDELVSGIDDELYQTTTDDYSGAVLLLLRINLSCEFRGSVYAFSGHVQGEMHVDVVTELAEE